MSVPFPDTASDDGTEARLLAEATPGDNAPPSPYGDNDQALSVSQLSAAIKRTVEDGFARVRVRGELSGAKRAASGHFYAALKDDNALIDMVMWKGQAVRLAFRPEDGIEVIATGKLTTYPGRSNYQMVVERMEVAGEGALLGLVQRKVALVGDLADQALDGRRSLGTDAAPVGQAVLGNADAFFGGCGSSGNFVSTDSPGAIAVHAPAELVGVAPRSGLNRDHPLIKPI